MRQRLYGGVRGSLCKEALYSITTNIEINHFIDLIMSDSFNEQGGNSLLAQNGIRLKEDFEGILVVGETIIVVDKDLGESS